MERILCAKSALDRSFVYLHKKDALPEQVDFKLHSHTGYEILIFLKGEADFIVEGSVYSLKPMDIVLTRHNEMHQMKNRSRKDYERIVINLEDSFFEQMHCHCYTDIFLNRKNGEGNLIKREAVKKNELFDTLLRLEKYIKQKKKENETIVRCVLTEFLHQLNELDTSGNDTVQNETVKNVIQYINSHLNSDLPLDALAERFYISKYHLCRCFRQCTGFTVNQYITYRRMMLVRDLYRSGKSLSTASSEAGFSSYSNFYKAYIKETGYPPSEGLAGQMKG